MLFINCIVTTIHLEVVLFCVKFFLFYHFCLRTPFFSILSVIEYSWVSLLNSHAFSMVLMLRDLGQVENVKNTVKDSLLYYTGCPFLSLTNNFSLTASFNGIVSSYKISIFTQSLHLPFRKIFLALTSKTMKMTFCTSLTSRVMIFWILLIFGPFWYYKQKFDDNSSGNPSLYFFPSKP